MSDSLADYRKVASKLARTSENLAVALKDLQSAAAQLEDRPFAIAPTVAEVRKALTPIATIAESLAPLLPRLEQLEVEGRTATERGRARLAGTLHEELAHHGLALHGRLPTPTVGPLSLEFVFGTKAVVKIYYGPKVALLETVPLDPSAVASAVAIALKALDDDDFDQPLFLAELHRAWRIALVRLDLPDGERAPIRAVHAAIASGRQPAHAFEPNAKGVVAYSAVKFSHDLSRLRTRRATFGELALTVATREQTKKTSDHLWIDGTHYAFIAFR